MSSIEPTPKLNLDLSYEALQVKLGAEDLARDCDVVNYAIKLSRSNSIDSAGLISQIAKAHMNFCSNPDSHPNGFFR